MSVRWSALLAVVILLASGCAHQQLRRNTVHQARTLTEIYEQQVLDNLAMFVQDPDALPFFSIPQGGTNQVVDFGSAGTDLRWSDVSFLDGVLRLNGSRSITETWNLAPVSDPRRLELMRCAYQQAVAACGLAKSADFCPDCTKLQQHFHAGGNANMSEFTMRTGRTSPACLESVCWFGFGCKKCVPKDGDCPRVGNYCHTYVWVLPGGRNELSKLTLLILDYAINQPALPPPAATVDFEYRLNHKMDPVKAGETTALVLRGTLDAEKLSPPFDPKAPTPNTLPPRASLLESLAKPPAQEWFQAPFADPIFGLEQRLRALTPPPVQP